MTSSKLLKIIFGVLIVVIISELIYYYIQTNHQTFYRNKNLINKTKSNQNISKESESDYINYLTKMINIATNQKLKNLTYKRYFLVYELKGKLIKIDTKGQNSPNPSLMKFGLYIKSEENTKEDYIYLPPKILSTMKVYLVQNDVERLIGINQLKEGDVISFQYFEDLSYKISDKNREVYVVIKIYR